MSFTASWHPGGGFSLALLEERPGFIVFKGPHKLFKDEAGGHRWQRVPPTEKRGRVQTSTITVAVLPIPKKVAVQIQEKDLDWKFCRGSGAGGQHRNVTDSAVQLTHLPTGIRVRCENERSQHLNKDVALEVLSARLSGAANEAASASRASKRRAQIGSGMRGDKRRTIRAADDSVVDHITGKSWSYKKYRKGDWA